MRRPDRNRRPMSVEEYLHFEAASPSRHEYVAGEVYALAGVTLRHSRIVMNLGYRLHAAARGGACRVMTTDVRLRVGGDRFYYPDVMVACTPKRDDAVVVSDPCLLIEVTSPGTARIDRGEKLEAYRRITSLGAYLVVDQRRRRVERHWRDPDGRWRRDEIAGTGEILLPCPRRVLRLGQIYEGIELALGEDEPDYEVVGAE